MSVNKHNIWAMNKKHTFNFDTIQNEPKNIIHLDSHNFESIEKTHFLGYLFKTDK